MNSAILFCLKVLGMSAPVLIALALYLWERRKAAQDEELLAELRATDLRNAVEAKNQALRVEGLELERARAVVAAYEEAKKKAKGVTSEDVATDSANAALRKFDSGGDGVPDKGGGTPSGDSGT